MLEICEHDFDVQKVEVAHPIRCGTCSSTNTMNGFNTDAMVLEHRVDTEHSDTMIYTIEK